MSKKIFLFVIIIIIALIFATVANSQNYGLFSTRSAFYFTKEWSNDINLLLTNNSAERIEKQIGYCSEKLVEIKKTPKESIGLAIEDYLKETEKLKMACASLNKLSSKTLSENIIRELFSHKKFLTATLNDSEESKSIIELSFKNFINSALSISSEEDVLENIKIYTLLQNSNSFKIKNLNQFLAHSPSEEFKNKIISLKIEIIKEAAKKEDLTTEDKEFFEKEFAEIKKTDFYQRNQFDKELGNKEKIKKMISDGKWIDDVITISLGEETEALEEFKLKLKNIEISKLDQEIEDLQVYDETKALIRDGKNYIISSLEDEEEDELFSEKEQMPFLTASAIDIIPGELPLNPASSYCIRQGYKLEEVNKEGKQCRNCIINKDNICEEWSFYKGECKIKETKK